MTDIDGAICAACWAMLLIFAIVQIAGV